jgi:hypothetical protein
VWTQSLFGRYNSMLGMRVIICEIPLCLSD